MQRQWAASEQAEATTGADAELQPGRHGSDDQPIADPRVAVVVITHNRVTELEHTLDLLAQLPERPEVVVVDNGSTDGTATLVRQRFGHVRLLAVGRNLGAAGRNLGVAVVDAPYVAFCDDDTWWSPGSLRGGADLLDAHPQVAVATARILVEPGGVDDPICADLRDSPLPTGPDLPGPRLASFLAGASIVRRAAFLGAGGFAVRLGIGGEEELLAADLMTAGWAIVYAPALLVHHRPSTVRQPHLRRRQGIRNTLWFTWLRRPVPSACRRTGALVRRLPRDLVSLRGVAEAVKGLPWVLRERRVVPPEVEVLYAMLDTVQFDSGARSYVS